MSARDGLWEYESRAFRHPPQALARQRQYRLETGVKELKDGSRMIISTPALQVNSDSAAPCGLKKDRVPVPGGRGFRRITSLDEPPDLLEAVHWNFGLLCART
jgi:hypothetical protein